MKYCYFQSNFQIKFFTQREIMKDLRYSLVGKVFEKL